MLTLVPKKKQKKNLHMPILYKKEQCGDIFFEKWL